MAKFSAPIFLLAAFIALTSAAVYFEKDIEAYHFHTYIFDENPRQISEALNFRIATRQRINEGFLPQCSLGPIYMGWDGPHPYTQYELCCNKTSFPAATAWNMQNHGNLSILVHPLTVEDLADHEERATWIGQPVPLDTECPCLYPILPKPRPCPVYPEYPDEMPTKRINWVRPAGTEDYRNVSGLNLLDGNY